MDIYKTLVCFTLLLKLRRSIIIDCTCDKIEFKAFEKKNSLDLQRDIHKYLKLTFK